MNRQLLFIQGGGGDDGYKADKKLADSLQAALDNTYDIVYPKLETDENIHDFGWLTQIEKNITDIQDDVILVGHSLGASMILKLLSERTIEKKFHSIFLIATPFWSGSEDWVQGLKLPRNFEDKLPKDVPMFFYQAQDDEEVPFEQFLHYKQKLPWATFREIKQGGHQLNNDLSTVAKDIKSF